MYNMYQDIFKDIPVWLEDCCPIRIGDNTLANMSSKLSSILTAQGPANDFCPIATNNTNTLKWEYYNGQNIYSLWSTQRFLSQN
jgi:hypothetical protein